MEQNQKSQQDLIKDCIVSVQCGNLNQVSNFILNHGISVNAADENNCSLLHWAAINQRIEIILLLISHAVNINQIGGDFKETPVQWAIRSQYIPVIDIFLQHGCDLHHKSIYGYDALHLAVHSGNINIVSLLCMYSNINMEYPQPDHPLDINSVNLNGETVLSYMLKYKPECVDMIRLLLSYRCNVFHLDKNGNNVLTNLLTYDILPVPEDGKETKEQEAERLKRLKLAQTPDFILLELLLNAANEQFPHYKSTLPIRNNGEEIAIDRSNPNLYADSTASLMIKHKMGPDGSRYLLYQSVNNDGLSPYVIALKHRLLIARFAFDYALFHNFPKWLPTLMSCLLVLAFVGCTYFTGGWISALGTYTVCYLMYNYTSQQTLRPHFSRTSCGSAWGIILSITLGYVVFVHPVLSLDYITLSSVTHTIIFVCLILMTCLYFYLSISTIPGYVDTEFDRVNLYQTLVSSSFHKDQLGSVECKYRKPSYVNEKAMDASDRLCGSDNETDRLLDRHSNEYSKYDQYIVYQPIDFYDEDFKLCTTCVVNKHNTPCTTHCMYCNRCTETLDHHCPFIDNCVGVNNRKYFVLFTLFASIGLIYFSVLLRFSIVHHYCLSTDANWSFGYEWKMITCVFWNERAIFTLYIMAISCALWIGGICYAQLGMVALETTTYELQRGAYGHNIEDNNYFKRQSVTNSKNRVDVYACKDVYCLTLTNHSVCNQLAELCCICACSPTPMNGTSSSSDDGVIMTSVSTATGMVTTTMTTTLTAPSGCGRVSKAIHNLWSFICTGHYIITTAKPTVETLKKTKEYLAAHASVPCEHKHGAQCSHRHQHSEDIESHGVAHSHSKDFDRFQMEKIVELPSVTDGDEKSEKDRME